MSTPAPLNIAIFQCDARDEDVSARLDRLDAAASRAAGDGASLLVTPEVFVSGYGGMPDRIHARAERSDGPAARRTAEIAAHHGIAIVLGYPEAADGVVYNSALCVGPGGEVLANHRKLGLSGTDEQATYAHGDRITLFELNGHRIAVLICYDVEFPEIVRAGAQAGATTFVVPTALVTRWPTVAEKMIPTRALENGSYIAYANYSGREDAFEYLGSSCIVDPEGQDLVRAGAGEELLVGTVDPERLHSARRALHYLEDCQGLPRF